MSNDLRIEIGRTWIWTEEISRMRVGSTVELEGTEGSDVSVYFNGRLIAKGQPVVVKGNIGVRITEVFQIENQYELLIA